MLTPLRSEEQRDCDQLLQSIGEDVTIYEDAIQVVIRGGYYSQEILDRYNRSRVQYSSNYQSIVINTQAISINRLQYRVRYEYSFTKYRQEKRNTISILYT